MHLKTKRLFFQAGWLSSMALLLIFLTGCPPDKDVALNIRMEAAATICNPLLVSPGYSGYVAAQVFQTLGLPDPESLEMKPSLAKAIPKARRVTEGAHQGEQAYDFVIHEAATWDNGSPITAEDFVFTLKVLLHQNLPTAFRGYYQYLSGVDVDAADPKKFTVYMRQFYILAQEALCSTPVYPQYHYDPQGRLKNVTLADMLDPAKGKAFAESENGKAFLEEFTSPKYTNEPASISASGPYRLQSMNGDQGVILVKKKNWWADDASLANPLLGAYPDRLVYKIVKDESATESLLQTEDLDIAVDLSMSRFKEMQQDTHLTRLYDFKTGWAPRYGRLLFNLHHEDSILADVQVRRALAYIIDYDYLINTIQQGLAQPIIGPIHPKKPYYAKDVATYTYNATEAMRLLSQAGWADTNNDGALDKMLNGRRQRLSLKMMVPNGNQTTQMTAESISEKAKQIKVEIILDPQDISNITKKTRQGDFQMASLGASTQVGLDELNQYYHSGSADNRGRYRNIRLDSIIDAIGTQENETARNALYVEAQRILHDDIPALFLYSSSRRYIIAKKFKYVLAPYNAGFYEQLFQLQ